MNSNNIIKCLLVDYNDKVFIMLDEHIVTYESYKDFFTNVLKECNYTKRSALDLGVLYEANCLDFLHQLEQFLLENEVNLVTDSSWEKQQLLDIMEQVKIFNANELCLVNDLMFLKPRRLKLVDVKLGYKNTLNLNVKFYGNLKADGQQKEVETEGGFHQYCKLKVESYRQE